MQGLGRDCGGICEGYFRFKARKSEWNYFSIGGLWRDKSGDFEKHCFKFLMVL